MMDDIYAYADELLKALYKEIEAEFRQARSRLPFDELNALDVRQRIRKLYANLDEYARKAFRAAAEKAVADAKRLLVSEGIEPDESVAADTVVYSLLSSASPVTGYVYENEVDRKAARHIEALLAAKSLTAHREAFRRAMSLWARQVKQYTDDAVYEAMVAEFRVSGVKYVRWYTREDERVCRTCKPRHGRRYRIGSIPVRHYGCRCELVPTR